MPVEKSGKQDQYRTINTVQCLKGGKKIHFNLALTNYIDDLKENILLFVEVQLLVLIGNTETTK